MMSHMDEEAAESDLSFPDQHQQQPGGEEIKAAEGEPAYPQHQHNKEYDLLASPYIANILMSLIYLSGAIGIANGMYNVLSHYPSSSSTSLTSLLDVATLLTIFLPGFLSFIRHSIFDQSDAIRMRSITSTTTNTISGKNYYQIEVGLANLAWSLYAFLAVVCRWGLIAQAAAFLVFGFYLLNVLIMFVVDSGRGWCVEARGREGVGVSDEEEGKGGEAGTRRGVGEKGTAASSSSFRSHHYPWMALVGMGSCGVMTVTIGVLGMNFAKGK